MSHQNPLCKWQATCRKSNWLLWKKNKKIGQWLSSLALWSIFISNKPLALTLFPSIKNLADSWHGCRTSAVRSPSATWVARCQAGSWRTLRHTSAQLLDCHITSYLLCAWEEVGGRGGGEGDYTVFTQQIVHRHWAYLLSAANEAPTCSQALWVPQRPMRYTEI